MAQWLVDSIPDDDPEIMRDMNRLNQINRDRASAAEAYFRANAMHWDRVRTLYVDEATIERKLLELSPARCGNTWIWVPARAASWSCSTNARNGVWVSI